MQYAYNLSHNGQFAVNKPLLPSVPLTSLLPRPWPLPWQPGVGQEADRSWAPAMDLSAPPMQAAPRALHLAFPSSLAQPLAVVRLFSLALCCLDSLPDMLIWGLWRKVSVPCSVLAQEKGVSDRFKTADWPTGGLCRPSRTQACSWEVCGSAWEGEEGHFPETQRRLVQALPGLTVGEQGRSDFSQWSKPHLVFPPCSAQCDSGTC